MIHIKNPTVENLPVDVIKRAAVTGHTQRLGKAFFQELEQRGYQVTGFSQSTGHDIRDFSVVSKIIALTQGFDLFVNSAKPDFAQTQILYRLARSQSIRTVLSIGSAAVTNSPPWTDTHLLEYLTQKVALDHAHRVLPCTDRTRLILVHPQHLDDDCLPYVREVLDSFNL